MKLSHDTTNPASQWPVQDRTALHPRDAVLLYRMARRDLSRTGGPANGIFDVSVWQPALEKYGAVAQLTVALYGADAQVVCGPTPATPIVSMVQDHGFDPGVFQSCATACLARPNDNRAPVIVRQPPGLAAVGASLLRDGRVVGAVVGGYASVAVGESVAARRLLQDGELLQVFAETLLRENHLRRQSEKAARQLSHLASHDALTGLPNRMLLADRLARARATARRHHRQMAVLVVDLDRFKHVNDSFGHQLGDQLLRLVAGELTSCVRHADTVSRLGGDEFVVVLAELERAEDAGVVAQKIIDALGRSHSLAGRELHLTVSIGICVFQGDEVTAETLLGRADKALYDAKDRGRGCYRFYGAT